MTTSMMSSSITECITRQQVSLYMDGDGRACLVRLAKYYVSIFARCAFVTIQTLLKSYVAFLQYIT